MISFTDSQMNTIARYLAFRVYGMPERCEKCGAKENLVVINKMKNYGDVSRGNLKILCKSCWTRGTFRARKTFTDNELRRIIEQYEGGMPAAELAKQNHTSYENMRGLLVEQGMVIRPPGHTPRREDVTPEMVHDLRNEGLTNKQVQKKLGISYGTVYGRMKEYDEQTRHP